MCRLFDVYEGPDTIDLVMECLEGGELYQRVNQGRFSDAWPVSYCAGEFLCSIWLNPPQFSPGWVRWRSHRRSGAEIRRRLCNRQ